MARNAGRFPRQAKRRTGRCRTGRTAQYLDLRLATFRCRRPAGSRPGYILAQDLISDRTLQREADAMNSSMLARTGRRPGQESDPEVLPGRSPPASEQRLRAGRNPRCRVVRGRDRPRRSRVGVGEVAATIDTAGSRVKEDSAAAPSAQRPRGQVTRTRSQPHQHRCRSLSCRCTARTAWKGSR